MSFCFPFSPLSRPSFPLLLKNKQKKKLTEPSQVVSDVPHAPVGPPLLRREPRRQNPSAAGAAKALEDPIQRPEGAEPRHPGPGPESDVDCCRCHEPARQHQTRGRAGSEDARDELGHAVGDREERGEGSDLFFFKRKNVFLEREKDFLCGLSSSQLSKAKARAPKPLSPA